MKNIIATILLCIAGLSSKGQSADWKVIGSPDTFSVEILVLTNANELVGFNHISGQLLYSNNDGKTWASIIEKFDFYSYQYLPLKSNSKNEIYFFEAHFLYKLDKNLMKFSPVLQFDLYEYIQDVDFFANGNLLVGTKNSVYLYSENHSLIRKVDWSKQDVNILLGKENEKHYIFHYLNGKYVLSEITENTLFLNGNVECERNIIRAGNRLIFENQYSDDGWQTVKNTSTINKYGIKFQYVGRDNKLYSYSYHDTVYIIEPTKFDVISKFVKDGIQSMFVSLDGKIFVNQDYCVQHQLCYSESAGKTWTRVDSNKDVPISQYFAVNRDENLFTVQCSKLAYKSKESKIWRNVDFGPFWYHSKLISFSNGSIVAYKDGESYISSDNGETWKVVVFSQIDFFSEIIEKNGVLNYLSYNDTLTTSFDFGKTWQNSSIDDTNFKTVYGNGVHAFSNTNIFYKNSSSTRILNIYDLNSKITSSSLLSVLGLIDIETSFDMRSLYVLVEKEQDIYNVAVSNDKGSNFTYFTIPLKNANYSLRLTTDHLGNVYVFSDSQVLISKDHGATWTDITPSFPNVYSINDLKVSFDNYVYLSTNGYGILKFKQQLAEPRQLTVTVYDDLNKNCVKEANELGVPNARIALNTNGIWPVDSTGNATLYTIYDNNELNLLYNQNTYKNCQDTYTANFDSMTTMIHLDVPLQTLKYCAETQVSISAARLRRCFDNRYYGQVCNDGNITAKNAEIKIILDRYFEFVDATLPIISLQDSILILDAGDVAAGKCVDFAIGIKINCDATLGQKHCIKVDATHSSASCDIVAPRGEYMECQENIGSFDPNDKTIFVNGVRNQTYIEKGDNIEYMIRFQNTGTDTAFTVRIEDPISQKFNIRSIQPLSSSHAYEWSIDQNVLKIVFNKINLVDSFTNEPASNGFVKFSIEAAESIINGQELSNQAGIYFDFNEPVITNQVVTNVGKPVGTLDWNSKNSLLVNPNPTAEATFIDLDYLTYQNSTCSIHDISGKIIMSEQVSRSANRISTEDLAPGCYIICLKSGDKMAYGKLIKL